MEENVYPRAIAITRPRLYGIVQTYMQKQLPRDIHPAFKALRDREEAATIAPRIDHTQDPTFSTLLERHERSRVEIIGGSNEEEDGDDDAPLEEIYKDAASEKELFKAAIETYEKTTKDSKYKTNIMSDATHTWEEVLAEVDAASERYNDVSGLWGKIRKGFRSFGANSKVFDAWTGLLPTQSNYLSVLCGGLKLVFSAAGRLKDLRKEICEALAEIPTLLASTHRALGAFKRSKELHLCSAALYTATIAALRHIVEWYNEKAMKKLSKSLFKQSSYEHQLSDLIQAIRTQSQRFDTCAKLSSYEIIRHTNDTVRSHHKDSQNNQQEIVGHLDRLNMNQFQQDSLLGNIIVTETGKIQQTMGVMAGRLSEMSEGKIKELIEITVKGTLENFLSSNDRIDYRTQDVREPTLSVRNLASESQMLKESQRFRQQLLTGLEYEDSVLEQDVETKLQTIWTLPRQDQDRVVAIMCSHKLQKWITSVDSSALFINANHKVSTHQQPTSFISAKLVDSITLSPSNALTKPHLTLPLAFFCSQHLQPDDPDSGPDGMMRNLLAQLLLLHHDFDLRTIQRMQTTLDYSSVNDLCDIFHLLILQLPPYIVVFCVIDSISFYEDNVTVCEEASIALQALVDVVERTKGNGCTFKLLLMSSWNSRVLYKDMLDQEGDVVWMPAKVPAQGGFTSMKWSASVDSNLVVTDPRLG